MVEAGFCLEASFINHRDRAHSCMAQGDSPAATGNTAGAPPWQDAHRQSQHPEEHGHPQTLVLSASGSSGGFREAAVPTQGSGAQV